MLWPRRRDPTVSEPADPPAGLLADAIARSPRMTPMACAGIGVLLVLGAVLIGLKIGRAHV